MNMKEAVCSTLIRVDGKDHVWVSPFAGTQIGRLASISWRRKFFIPRIGGFISPVAFVAWLYYADEGQRFSTEPKRLPRMKAEEYNAYQDALYYAKFCQLANMKPRLEEEKELLNLPWVEYRQHSTGLKEFPRSQVQAEKIKTLARLVIEFGPKGAENLLRTDENLIREFDLQNTIEWVLDMVYEKFVSVGTG